MIYYEYDGFLNKSVLESVEFMSKSYRHCLEIFALPEGWCDWVEKNLKDHEFHSEDCMGNPCQKISKMYGLVNRDEKSKFIFFDTKEEMNLFLIDFPNLVVNPKPFKSGISK